MMKDSIYVFEKENFEGLSPESKESIISLFKLVTDSINTFVPLKLKDAYWTKSDGKNTERVKYKYMNDCISFKPILKDSTINSKGNQLRTKLLDIVSKIETNKFTHVEVCNYGPDKKPRIDYSIKNKAVKGRYSYHLVRHVISNHSNKNSKSKIENIEEELIKIKEIANDIVYEIGVSSEIGLFD